MATLDELEAKLAEYRAASDDTDAKRQQRDTDRAASDAALVVAEVSHTAWLDALRHQHALDDEFDALSAAHEPPDLPAVG